MTEDENKRQAHRRRAILGGRIFDDDGKSGICIVNDMSTTGARVKTKTDFDIGSEVYLRIDRFNDLRQARVMWHREGFTGLKFNREITRPPAAMAAFLNPISDL